MKCPPHRSRNPPRPFLAATHTTTAQPQPLRERARRHLACGPRRKGSITRACSRATPVSVCALAGIWFENGKWRPLWISRLHARAGSGPRADVHAHKKQWYTMMPHIQIQLKLTPPFFLSLPPFLILTPAVKSDLCDASVESVSGYFNITGTRDAAYFYWLFESRGNPSTDPLVVWLTGGPVGGEGGRKGRSKGGTRLDMGMGGSEPDTKTLTTSPPSFLSSFPFHWKGLLLHPGSLRGEWALLYQ